MASILFSADCADYGNKFVCRNSSWLVSGNTAGFMTLEDCIDRCLTTTDLICSAISYDEGRTSCWIHNNATAYTGGGDLMDTNSPLKCPPSLVGGD